MLLVTLVILASPWHLDASAGTDFPLDVGGRVQLEGPGRLLATASVGLFPEGYLTVINGVLVAANAYPQSTADLIAAALKNAVVARVRIGWRPFAERGFYFLVGYGIAALGGSLTGADLITTVTGKPPVTDSGAKISATAASVLHQLDFELGWRWFLWRGLFVQASAGGFFTVGASTNIVPQTTNARLSQQLVPIAAEGAAYLNGTYTTYLHSPTASLQLGWRFF